jgi:catechol-2,3-dioxygenase
VALQVANQEELRRWYEWLKQCGVDVLGPVDHKGIIESIYFHDPNGIRLELTVPLDKEWNRHTRQGYDDLKLWVQTKEHAKREGRDPGEALREMIRETKRRYQTSMPR